MAGDAADDAYDAAEEEASNIFWIWTALRSECPSRCDDPEWFRNHDGLFECKRCGRMVDL